MSLFSRRTIFAAIDAFDFSQHAYIDEFIARFQLEDADTEADQGLNPRTVALKRFLLDNPDRRGPDGANITQEIIEHLLSSGPRPRNRPSRWNYVDQPAGMYPEVVHALKLDGYSVTETKLIRMVPEETGLPQPDNELKFLLEEFKFTTTHGHLDQATNAFTRGDWAAANAQIRSFVESLFEEIAHLVDANRAASLHSSSERRQMLAAVSPPFFLQACNEWTTDRNQPGYVQGLWARLHPQGSHPGLSDEDDCTFRMQIAALAGSYFLRRLKDRT